MKQGKPSLSALAAEIERQAAAKVDYIADTRKLEMVPVESDVRLVMHNGSDVSMGINANAHRQIGERLDIPAKYYEKMRSEQPELLATNVNTWFREQPEKRMVRTLDGAARAFLSNRYQRVDNVHVAEVALPELLKVPQIEIVSSEITQSRLYIKAITKAVQATVNSRRVGDVVCAGVMIRNSEVGLGAVEVVPFYDFLVCRNGMVRTKQGMRSAHIGTKWDGDENLAEILQDDTREAIDRAVLLKVRDHVHAALDEVAFHKVIEQMQETTERLITGDPAKAIEVLSNDFVLTQTERASVLRHLIAGGDISQYGVVQAVTRTAEDVESYDRATDIEAMGGRILDLAPANWARIAEAA